MYLYMLLSISSAAMALPAVFTQPISKVPPLPIGPPQPPPKYMVSNVNNQFGVAPDKGVLNGPVIAPLNASLLQELHVNQPSWLEDIGESQFYDELETGSLYPRQSGTYWVAGVTHGSMPLAPAGYQFYRNVMDYGAKGDGKTDDTAAINRAASAGNRCGQTCGSTTTLGALVYFPPGTYVVSTPIIQYYYTQFVGSPNSKAIIQGAANFSGIALFDSDPYIPGGKGAEWYINQSNFYRQIRNFVMDLTKMASNNTQGDQTYVPTGIHWQVGQATSITNVDFKMAVSTSSGAATAVGLFMENGSGGFVSDLTFTGGNIGMRVGSQQFTARNIQFTSCLTAISMIWNWGFTWQNIYVLSCYVAFDCTAHGGSTNQGTGSLSVLDSHFNGVPYAITVSSTGTRPNLILDNLLVENSQSVVLVSGGADILPGSSGAVTFSSWAMGLQYLNTTGKGNYQTGLVNPAPNKAPSLLNPSGQYFTRAKPQYESQAAATIIVATAHGVSNKMTGDQSSAINSLLSGNVGSTIFFPAGIYLVQNTVQVPVGSIIVGEGWSQIMATGTNFQNQAIPKVMVQVGNQGDSGIVEISDMLFTVQGPTAGCILMEWNVHESSQGSAGMWDSHFRVGGANGTNLQLANCPTGGSTVNSNCMAATMMLHVTTKASGYFENVWLWNADHDLDNPLNAKITEGTSGIPENVQTDISVYTGRGLLVESQGPTWFYGTASEHSQLYQYQLSSASNIFLGHMQTETPYYQPQPNSLSPYKIGQFASDPFFGDCGSNSCATAWALRVLNSSNIFIYSAGFYSFFQHYALGCADSESCQQRVVETNYTQGLWLYNLFTKGSVELISPLGGILPIFFNDSNQNEYTSEVAAWLPLALTGANIGASGNGTGPVYIDPTIWKQPSPTVACQPPCTLILPPYPLSTTTTITFPPYTTSVEVGCYTPTTISGSPSPIKSSVFVSVTVTTTVTIPPLTTTAIPVWNVPINNTGSTIIYPTSSVQPPPFVITDNPSILSSIGNCITSGPQTRSLTPAPYPYSQTTRDTHFPSITETQGNPNPTCTAHCGSSCGLWCLAPCLLLCPFGIGGFFPPNDPNIPIGPGGGSATCMTTTTSACRTQCRTTPTSSCSSTCSPVIGCDTTGTNIASTITPAPAVDSLLERWPTAIVTDPAVISSVAQAVMQRLSSYGDYTPTSTPQPYAWQVYELFVVSGGPGGGSVQVYSWYGTVLSSSNNANPCTDKENIDKQYDHSSNPQYPTSLGTFALTGHSSCSYSAPDSNSIGSITCSDGYKTSNCISYTSQSQSNPYTCDGNGKYYPKFFCKYS